MNRVEDFAIERLDRKREAHAAKAARSARSMYLRMSARRVVTMALADISDPAEQAAILGDLIDIAAERRWPLIGRVPTATGLNAVAADVCSTLRAPVAKARAEQAYASLTREDIDGMLP
ncbi:MAG: hypothetical protein EON87_01015 [Brevundimonas sp.]|nr:MAG: hypothetical protein EON87_01015 [Brevundimonas sp.]